MLVHMNKRVEHDPADDGLELRTQNKDIAFMLDINPVSLSRLRNGHRKPSLEMIAKIEKLLGWPTSQQIKAYHHKDPLKYGDEFRKFLKSQFGIPDQKEGPDDPATATVVRRPRPPEPDEFETKKPGRPYLGVVFGDERDL